MKYPQVERRAGTGHARGRGKARGNVIHQHAHGRGRVRWRRDSAFSLVLRAVPGRGGTGGGPVRHGDAGAGRGCGRGRGGPGRLAGTGGNRRRQHATQNLVGLGGAIRAANRAVDPKGHAAASRLDVEFEFLTASALDFDFEHRGGRGRLRQRKTPGQSDAGNGLIRAQDGGWRANVKRAAANGTNADWRRRRRPGSRG